VLFGGLAILYARGYRFGIKEKSVTLSPRGILSITSDPSGAQVFIDGKLETATDNTISLSPNTYTVRVQKDGFLSWEKELSIEKEIVLEAHAFLIPSAPSLTALTFSGSLNPQLTSDFSKIAFVIPPNTENGVELSPEGSTKAGLWVIELTNLPLGFNRDPRQITDGDLTKATWKWSPDGREILFKIGEKSYLLDTSKFTSQLNRIPIPNSEEITKNWDEKNKKILTSQLSNLPKEIQTIFGQKPKTSVFLLSEDKILYNNG
jgi:dipeptidyl aminopeptidase/acylaminoacyl peptidase